MAARQQADERAVGFRAPGEPTGVDGRGRPCTLDKCGARPDVSALGSSGADLGREPSRHCHGQPRARPQYAQQPAWAKFKHEDQAHGGCSGGAVAFLVLPLSGQIIRPARPRRRACSLRRPHVMASHAPRTRTSCESTGERDGRRTGDASKAATRTRCRPREAGGRQSGRRC
jgi:hypothetical protein